MRNLVAFLAAVLTLEHRKPALKQSWRADCAARQGVSAAGQVTLQQLQRENRW